MSDKLDIKEQAPETPVPENQQTPPPLQGEPDIQSHQAPQEYGTPGPQSHQAPPPPPYPYQGGPAPGQGGPGGYQGGPVPPYPPYAPYPPYPYPMPQKRPGRGMSIAAMVLGICSVVILWTGVITGILALIFGLITLRKPFAIKGMSIAGIVTGAIGLILSIIVIAAAIKMGTMVVEGFVDDPSNYWDLIQEFEEFGGI